MKYKKNQAQVNEIVNRMLILCAPLGLTVSNRSVTTASVYLKFKDKRLRSLTIRDHKTIPKYRYKWNIIIGYKGPNKVVDKGITRFMYNEHQVKRIVDHIYNYKKKIDKNNEVNHGKR